MNRGILYYLMIPLLVAAALLQSTAAPRIAVNGVKPDLVLVLVLIGTLVYGSRSGVAWAFVGGLALDVLSGGPLGSSSLALMAAAIVGGVGHRTLSRYHLLVPIGAAMAGTLVYGLTYVGILSVLDALSSLAGLDVLQHRLPIWSTLQNVIAPALLYNTALMLLAIPFLNRVPESQEAVGTFG